MGSDVAYESVEEDPVNPFQKRVFEKKMRRSSVGSDNIDPTCSMENLNPNINKMRMSNYCSVEKAEKRVR